MFIEIELMATLKTECQLKKMNKSQLITHIKKVQEHYVGVNNGAAILHKIICVLNLEELIVDAIKKHHSGETEGIEIDISEIKKQVNKIECSCSKNYEIK
tara:strand:+ start:674 stop:973 length:300 start_codon:yes stop_codon:yes gene_type:complete